MTDCVTHSLYVRVYIYIYIYIQRERERERALGHVSSVTKQLNIAEDFYICKLCEHLCLNMFSRINLILENANPAVPRHTHTRSPAQSFISHITIQLIVLATQSVRNMFVCVFFCEYVLACVFYIIYIYIYI